VNLQTRLPVIFKAQEEGCLICYGEALTKMSLTRHPAVHVLLTLHRIVSQGYNLVHDKGYSKSAFSWQYLRQRKSVRSFEWHC
jgi:hypothetical protein